MHHTDSRLTRLSLTLVACALTLGLRAGDRHGTDEADKNSDYQIHVMYVLPKDARDWKLDSNGTIEESVESALAWMRKATNGRGLRFDRLSDDGLDITFLQLSRTHCELVASTVSSLPLQIDFELWKAGFKAENKLYVVYYGGEVERKDCGVSTGRISLLAPRTRNCPVNFTSPERPSEWEFTLIHEVFHLLGAVPPNAPNYLAAHATDTNRDLMAKDYWSFPPVIDWNNDDYFNHGKEDLADLTYSVFLTGQTLDKRAELPPRWPYSQATELPRSAASGASSRPGSVAASLEVANLRAEPVRLYWLDYSGGEAWFQILYPADVLTMDTRKGSAWRVTDERKTEIAVFRVEAENTRYVVK